jgi:hypothetical protein
MREWRGRRKGETAFFGGAVDVWQDTMVDRLAVELAVA